MATIQEIIDKNRPVTEIISDLKEKAVYVRRGQDAGDCNTNTTPSDIL